MTEPTIEEIREFLEGARIIVVDDEAAIREVFRLALSKRGINVQVCANGQEAVDAFNENHIDLVITDLRMPVMDGMKLLKWVLGQHPLVPVIMLTAYATIEGAVEAMRIGAFDFIAKPVTDLKQLDTQIYRALQHRQMQVDNQWLKDIKERSKFDKMVGPSAPMQRIFEIITTVAPTDATVLVEGASGTGKELVARAIHFNSPRASRAFVKVNCAALPEGLIESELFGHEKGAFTGAFRTTRGKFEAAHGGTLLLDEIGEMPLGLQAKLLRVLQEHEFQRIGSNDTIKVDFRLIATTNIQLKKAVDAGKFREDLYYRLQVIPVELPVLSQRKDDISVLAYFFLRQFATRHSRSIDRISPEAMRYLIQAPWPGNVRELENAIERAVIMCADDALEIRHFFITNPLPDNVKAALSEPVVSFSQPTEAISLAELEKKHILSTLKIQSGHRAQTAKILGISIRTLRNKLNEYKSEGEDV